MKLFDKTRATQVQPKAEAGWPTASERFAEGSRLDKAALSDTRSADPQTIGPNV